MKYAQLITGLLIGTALGGSVVAATGGGAVNEKQIRDIVKDEIMNDPQLIMDSVQKFQMGQRDQQTAEASKKLADPDIGKALYDTPDTAFVGNKDGKHVVVEFFDYNCPACKMMFPTIEKMVAADKDFKMVFKEFPIFGPNSDHNAALGLALWHLHPDRYWEFYTRMMKGPGHAGPEATVSALKAMNINQAELEKEAKDPKYAKMVEDNRALADKLHIQGTPALIFKDKLYPGAMDFDQFKAAVDKE